MSEEHRAHLDSSGEFLAKMRHLTPRRRPWRDLERISACLAAEKSVNIWQSYEQERDCLVHFRRLLAVCWPSEPSAWDNHALARNFAKYSSILRNIELQLCFFYSFYAILFSPSCYVRFNSVLCWWDNDRTRSCEVRRVQKSSRRNKVRKNRNPHSISAVIGRHSVFSIL